MASVPSVTNWKPGEPTPAGYGAVTVSVSVPQSLNRRAQGLTGDGLTQVLLYVKDSSGTVLTDAFGSRAAYVAPIDAGTNKATFRLPPLPNSSIDPGAVAANGANAHRFEVRVYDVTSTDGIIVPTDFYGHFGAHANFDGRNAGNSADDSTELQSTALLASGETLSVVAPGLPIVVSVPSIYRHIGPNIDSHAFTPITEVSNSKNASADSDGKVRIRATYVDKDRLDSQNAKATLTIAGASTSVDTLAVTLSSGFGGSPWTVVGQGTDSAAVAADLATKFAATSAGGFYNFTSSASGLKLAAKSSLASSAGSFANTSAAINSGNMTGAVQQIPAVASKYTVTLTGSYTAFQRVNLTVTDAVTTAYSVANVSSASSGLSNIASALATALNTSGTNGFAGLYTATASGSDIIIESDAGQESPSRNLASDTLADAGATGVSLAVTNTTEVLGDANNINVAPTKQKKVIDFDNAPNPGDAFEMVYTDSLGATSSFSALAPDTTVANFVTAVRTAALADSAFANAFTIAQSSTDGTEGQDTLTFEAKFIPSIYSLGTASLPSSPFQLVAQSPAQNVSGVAFAAGTPATGELSFNLTSGDSYDFTNNTISVEIKRNGTTFFTKNNIAIAAAVATASVVTAVRDALNADTGFDDDFVASVGASTDKLKFATADTAGNNLDPFSPGTLAVTITRGGLPYAFSGGGTSLAFAPGSSTPLHRLRAIARFKSDTVFGASSPSLTAADGHRGTHSAGVSSLGAFVSSVVGEGGAAVATTADDRTFLQAGSNLIQVLDLAADGTTAGPWNFTIDLKGATLTENLEFQLLDIDTAPSADSTGITVNTQ